MDDMDVDASIQQPMAVGCLVTTGASAASLHQQLQVERLRGVIPPLHNVPQRGVDAMIQNPAMDLLTEEHHVFFLLVFSNDWDVGYQMQRRSFSLVASMERYPKINDQPWTLVPQVDVFAAGFWGRCGCCGWRRRTGHPLGFLADTWVLTMVGDRKLMEMIMVGSLGIMN